MCKVFELLPFVLLLLVFVETELNGPVVQIEDGALRGTFMETKKGKRFSAFMGIPYAEPPVGNLRFQAPIPVKPWGNVLDASKEHAVCPQRNIYTRTDLIEGSEDCLYLNVYTPQVTNEEYNNFAVMIFFHGGGYLCGGGNLTWYSPNILLDKDIILVVPNYRLGALGFLSTGDELCPGNNGLKDQNIALRWIQKNIHKFGGDPNRVTIFGESAGGASAHLHMLSTLSRGLFSAAISQSGTAFCSWTLAPVGEGVEAARKLARLVNCSTSCNVEMLNCLRKLDAHELIELDRHFMEWDSDPMIPFKPVVEPEIKEAFLTRQPIEIIKSGDFADIPWITGINTDEGALRTAGLYGNPHLVKELDENFDRVAPISLFYEKTARDPNFITKQIRKFYFNNEPLGNLTRKQLTNLYSDAWFSYAADMGARLHTKYFKSPVYYYLFGHRGKMSMSERFGDPNSDYGVCHADELQYIFDFGGLTETDNQVAEIFAELWSNFAKTGNPTPNTSSIITKKWHPVQSEKMEYFYIGPRGNLSMQQELYKERNEFWLNLQLHILQTSVKDEL